MFAEYPELSILQLKINVESEQLCHPILFPPQITGNYTKFLSCGRWISVKPTEATKVSHISERDTEHAAGPVTPQSPVISNYGLVLAVYLLYLVGFLTGITALAGVVIAYLQRDSTDRISQSHFQFQITTFWIGLLYFFVGLLTLHFTIGALILLWWVVWTVIRCVKGLLALNMGEAIRYPNSWWFGDP